MNIDYEKIQQLVLAATEKDLLDYVVQISNILATVAIGFITWKIFINTPKQNKIIKIQEKEIELLYRAFEHFHNFSDTVSLYISNKNRKYYKLSKQENLEASFSEKDSISTEAVYTSFKEYTLASHILRSIGDKNTENLIDIYKTKAVEIRTDIYDFENNYNENELKNFIDNLSKKRNELDKLKDQCFDSISQFKDTMKL